MADNRMNRMNRLAQMKFAARYISVKTIDWVQALDHVPYETGYEYS
jgi:hypothetical protein